MYGTLVRRARIERRLTQADLSSVSGIEQANISAIENERRMPSAETLHRLLTACGFELLAVAGPRALALPVLPEEDGAGGPVDRDGDPAREPELVGADTPMNVRVQLLTAALDASETIVRSR